MFRKTYQYKLDASVHKSVEYKYTFLISEEFNHPLIINDHIICWEMDMPNFGYVQQITDSYGYFGDTLVTNELLEIGYEITNIQSRDGEFHPANVKVISLKKLIEKTFSCKWTTPPPNTASETKKTKRR
ncbi:hypothetical protein WA1_50105 [Scytonema hofmannii PCC 7110]|uniref:Uncharacterized protein n=1 Tax=Scytonema hofmannii PCC 7110 TaxID=128403 RepID=A0A139WR32_9CYAN|nr:hypothetical protein [Scytonema hofmannii]KYC34882.1 hypothetical protein WA1_50105 [Scytonema hofmannii PCC 7110]